MQTTDFDSNVRPQDDFFGYVNNTWLEKNPIPASESTWGTFYVLRDQAWKAVSEIVAELTSARTDTLTHNQKTLRAFFTAATDYTSHKSKHIRTLQDMIGKIYAISTPSELAEQLGTLHLQGVSALWASFVGLDDHDSSLEIFQLYQSGLSLPNRDYYLEKDKRMTNIRSAYKAFYTEISTLLPSLLANEYDNVWRVELALARAAWQDVELRDIEKNYNIFSRIDLENTFTGFDWEKYFATIGINPSTLNVCQPSFLAKCMSLLTAENLSDIKAYLAWHTIDTYLGWISEPISKINFEFYGRTLSGTTKQKPLWKRAVLAADKTILGEYLGREYASRYFPVSSKKAVTALVEDIRQAYHTRIDRLDWMKPATKLRAHTKLDRIKVFVGYPTVWKDISSLKLVDDNIIANLIACHELNAKIELVKVGKKPAAEEWEMHAHTVNAYNHPNRLEIVFPAAILQPPFYDPEASYATNLGGIGAVIGHELTHGFDDQGSQFDEHGEVKSWQDEEEKQAFMAHAAHIVHDANHFETVPGIFLQGNLILGEAIADIGGIELAVEALRLSESNPEILKTGLQELFIAHAIVERGAATTEKLIELAKTDPHPPSPFRVNFVLNNVDTFYDTYGVAAGDKLYKSPEKRAKIW